MQIIIFHLQGQQYAIKTQQVEEISKLMDITPVPNAPDYIKGLINLRGNVISVMELSKLLQLQSEEDQKYQNIIITKITDEKIGLLVEEIYQVMEIEEDKIEKVRIEEKEQPGIKGIIQVGDQIVNLLELEECFVS
ncbi:chemotaxis protein CheW [Garciella nitratireducens]|uniref:Purine-binding chemotaxis protein CheW n=1 Tax=Garciella nitratireducens DSM 15102 TaxID=1121911 RepID=A0A1T4LF90_9FIRM|nr:chemotaxis protein CheW [Garciella nitratireducens]RBP46784.1 purine-binding chemotaxis protein CheW [Garciella nitratireducens]SJZ53452.1 purine-binding chemotaxis protein CheW [Garciella nitratireducens DSM 15102]